MFAFWLMIRYYIFKDDDTSTLKQTCRRPNFSADKK